jgi:hypothetical protein
MPTQLLAIIPGFGGTSLWTDLPFRRNTLVWLDPASLGLGGLFALQLDPSGTRPGRPTPPLQPRGLLMQFYGQLIHASKDLGFEPVAVAYDWRQHIPGQAALAAQQLDRTVAWYRGHGEPDVELYVVGHSMGGLIATLAYGLVSSATAAAWKQTVTLGTPFGGSYDAARAICGIGSWWEMILGATQYPTVNVLLIQAARQLLPSVIGTWPAIYDLMPTTQPGPYATLDRAAGRLYDPAFYASALVQMPLLGQHLTQAQGAQATIAAAIAGPLPPTVCVRSKGLMTTDHVSASLLPDRDTDPFIQGSAPGGDGVVPYDRAVLPGQPTWTLDGVDHQGLPQDPSVLAQLGELLRHTWPGGEISTLTPRTKQIPTLEPAIIGPPGLGSGGPTGPAQPTPNVIVRGDP